MDVVAAHCVGTFTGSSTYGVAIRDFDQATTLALRNHTSRVVYLGWLQQLNGAGPITDSHLLARELPGGVIVTASPDNATALSTTTSQRESTSLLFAQDVTNKVSFTGRMGVKVDDAGGSTSASQRCLLVLVLG